MEAIQILENVIKAIDSKKGESVKAIKVDSITVIADYFVITNGTNVTQIRAIADEIEYRLKQEGVMPLRVEGHKNNSWVLIDYGCVVVHVFIGESRQFYDLEHLWTDGENIDISQWLVTE